MSIVLAALAVAFAAFCVWLAVRIVNRRERWAKWTAISVVFAVPVIYVFSFAPACWLAADVRLINGESNTLEVLAAIYRPLISLTISESIPASEIAMQFAGLMPNGKRGRWHMACILGLDLFPPNYGGNRTDIVIEPRFHVPWTESE